MRKNQYNKIVLLSLHSFSWMILLYLYVFTICNISSGIVNATTTADDTTSKFNNQQDTKNNNDRNTNECLLYIAPSTIQNNHLSLYSGVTYKPYTIFGTDEIVIPITTPNKNEYSPWMDFTWSLDSLLQQQQNNSKIILPKQYQNYTDFIITGIPSMALCNGMYEIENDEDDDEDDENDEEVTIVNVRSNVEYNYNYRPYNIVDKSMSESSISNIHKYGIVTSKYGIIAGEELILKCETSSSTDESTEDNDNNNKETNVRHGHNIEWLKLNGICIDNFIVKDSLANENELNRGVYAKRTIDTNTTISISPVIHMDRSQLDIVYQQLYNDKQKMNSNDEKEKNAANNYKKNPLIRSHGIEYNNSFVLGQQLVTNFVFGHIHSNIILLPIAPGVNFINHYKNMDSSILDNNGQNKKQPNVGIRWSKQFLSVDEQNKLQLLLQKSASSTMQIYEEKVGTFVIEYYALQSINVGDELLLDYGHDWEQAYTKHQQQQQQQHKLTTSNTNKKEPFRHVISVPDGLYPLGWMKEYEEYGDFISHPLGPNHLSSIRWKHNSEIVTPWTFRIGLPESVRHVLLQYCNSMGITDVLKHATSEGNELEAGTETYINMPDNTQWYLQRPDKRWRSNLHWLSPGDEYAYEHYLQALSAAGFDSVLESIGQYLNMDGLVAYHVTFIGVSWSTEGFLHADVRDTGAKVYNIIIPLLLADDTGPELDIQSGMEDFTTNNTIGRYRYEYDKAIMLGDYSMHATSSCDYRTNKQFRLAATVYVADINTNNVNTMMEYITQAYPPDDPKLLLSWAGKHWKPNNITVQLPKVTKDHILSQSTTSTTTSTTQSTLHINGEDKTVQSTHAQYEQKESNNKLRSINTALNLSEEL